MLELLFGGIPEKTPFRASLSEETPIEGTLKKAPKKVQENFPKEFLEGFLNELLDSLREIRLIPEESSSGESPEFFR